MDREPIDAAILTDLQETAGDDFVADLVTTFLDEAPLLLETLRQSQASGDADAFRRAAHSLKSNAATFGAAPLAELSRSLELDGITTATGAALTALVAEFQRAAGALKDHVHG